jgi:hypothetical protein
MVIVMAVRYRKRLSKNLCLGYVENQKNIDYFDGYAIVPLKESPADKWIFKKR